MLCSHMIMVSHQFTSKHVVSILEMQHPAEPCEPCLRPVHCAAVGRKDLFTLQGIQHPAQLRDDARDMLIVPLQGGRICSQS